MHFHTGAPGQVQVKLKAQNIKVQVKANVKVYNRKVKV